MKTIAELSQDLITSLREGRQAIIGRGGTIANDAGFQDFRDAIYNIPADNAITTVTDNSIARIKTVPANSTKHAYLAEFGGMTYRCNNLFDISKALNAQLKSNGDGTYTITYNGSGSGRFSATAPIYIPANTPFVLKGTPISGVTNASLQFILADGTLGKTAYASGSTYQRTFEQAVTGVRMYISDEYAVGDSITFRDVQINLGDTALPYEPYFEGLRDAKPTEIVSNGANIWDEQTELGYWNGVDGGATQASNQIRSKNYIAVLPNTTYMNSNSFKIDLRFYDKDKRYIADSNSYSGTANSSFTTPSNAYYLKINLRSTYGTNYNNDIMLNIGSTIAPYVPYRAPISYPIPAEIQALEGFGKGVNSDYYNYIEWRDGRCYFVQNTKRIVFNGTESWTRSTATGIMQASVALPKIALFPHGISNLYHFVKYYGSDTLPEFRLTESGAQLYVETSLSDFADVDAWKSYLATRYASGNPVIVEYVLAEPIETEITTDMSPLIEVESGGTIEFVNEHDYAVPSKMVYQTLTQ